MALRHAVYMQQAMSWLENAGVHLRPRLKGPLSVASASWQRYSLPLCKPLTTASETQQRQGLLLSINLQQGNDAVTGFGEVAPLPGTLS